MENEKDLKSDLMEKIKSGEIKMKSRAYFISKSASFFLIAALIFLATIFLVSFIIFVLRGSGLWFLPGFGWPGIKIMLTHFPWFLVALSAIALATLEFLISRLGFAYRRPLIYSSLGVIVLAATVGLLISKTPLHPGAFRAAAEGKLPLAGMLYRSYSFFEEPNFVSGRVFEQVPEMHQMTIETVDGQKIKVEIPTSTNFIMLKKDPIKKDDMVMIMGDRVDSKIKAFGIRALEEEEREFFQSRGRMMCGQKNNMKCAPDPMISVPSSQE